MAMWGASDILSPLLDVSKRLDIDFLVCSKKNFFRKFFFAQLEFFSILGINKIGQSAHSME